MKCCIWKIRVKEKRNIPALFTDTYAAIKQADVVDHNFSFKDALCLPQQLSLISFIKSALSVQSSPYCKACGLFIIERMADVLTAFN